MTAVSLNPGAVAPVIPTPYLRFLPTGDPQLIVTLAQKQARYVKPGDSLEVTIPQYPGHVFGGRVRSVIATSVEGQLAPSGMVLSSTPTGTSRVFVNVEMDELPDGVEFVGGTGGMAAIYTAGQTRARHLEGRRPHSGVDELRAVAVQRSRKHPRSADPSR